MKHLLLLLVLLPAIHGVSQVPTERALLWKIQAPGSSTPSYLYGTFHMICPNDLVVDTIIKQAFISTKQLYLEIDMTDNTALAMTMVKHMKMQNDHTLSQFMSKADYDSVCNLFQSKTGIPLSNMLATTKPMLLSAMLYPALLNCQPDSWELTFIKMSEGTDMKIGGLETIEHQLSIFDSIPYKDQAESLKLSLFKFDSVATATKKLVSIYKSKNLQKMAEEVSSDKEFGQIESLVLDKRNAAWIPVMKQQMKIAPTFFAVGAGHLAGKNGVITLLRKSGYKVTAVR